MGVISAVLRQEGNKEDLSLGKNCPNTEFFLVRIFLYSDHKKLRIWTLLTQCIKKNYLHFYIKSQRIYPESATRGF